MVTIAATITLSIQLLQSIISENEVNADAISGRKSPRANRVAVKEMEIRLPQYGYMVSGTISL